MKNSFDYLGSFVYVNDNNVRTLESTSFAGGRINKTNNTYDINYFITDHLGSTRVIVNNAGEIKAQYNYYPFGKEHENPNLINSTNRWGFSGKEKQTVKDLGYLDFIARMYANSEIPMFTTQDPLAEKYYSLSPYMYCAGNPLRYVDPFGMDWYSYEEKYTDENNEEQTRIQYKYFDYELSKKEMEKGGYTHLGKTHTEGNTYYSLFGNTMDLRTQQGQIYQKIDEAIITYANWHIRELQNRNDPWAETFPMRYIDMSIKTLAKQLNIEYEGSIWGIYNNYTGKDALKGQINSEYFFSGIKENGQEVPFQFNANTFAPVPVGPKGFHLVIENSSRMGDKSPHIIDLSYTPVQAIKMREKYQKLFFGK
jgi:RHS repeat-associated protein